jgi:hypothetical protein
MKMIFLILLGFPFLSLQSQVVDPGFGYLSPGVGLWSHEFSSSSTLALNPAGAIEKNSLEGIILSRKPFLIEGLQAADAFLSKAFENNTVIGFSLHHLGYTGFRETGGAFSLGKSLSDHWRIGVGFGFSRKTITGIKPIPGFAGSLAIQRMFRGCTMGFILIPRQVPEKSGKNGKLRPSWIIGLGKDWSEQFYSDVNLYSLPENGLQLSALICYQPLPAWRMAIRVLSHPLRYGFETGYHHRQYSLRVFSDWHPQLGWSPGLLLAFSSSKTRQP